jgi:hypothetical protein
VDEQTIRIIEAFAKMNATDDADVVELAQRKVRTAEGVQKYDQPIGTIITKDMIERAVKKAAQAASSSLQKQANASAASSSAGPSPSAPAKVSGVPNVATPKLPSAGSVSKPTHIPGDQTTADLKEFYVSGYVNDPAAATLGWAQKQDGKWYSQQFENGQVAKEIELSPEQSNAIQAMSAKGLIQSVHIPDPAPEDDNDPKVLSKKINEALSSGKKTSDPDVSEMIKKLKANPAPTKKEQEAKAAAEKAKSVNAPEPASKKDADSAQPKETAAKTVEINGKQVKVGRYSRPKGFAKAFLIVQEDGQIFYEDKTGKRKKITAKSFEGHQNLGMTKHVTPDTGPIAKDSKYQDGKLVSDDSSAQAPEAAKVASVNKPTADTKTTEVKEPDTKSQAPVQAAPKEETAAGTVKIGDMTVKVGRYSRPKGFAKAFLIVNPDGTAEYEDKTGARKKLTANAFKKNWELGMNKFLTPETGAIKKGEHYEAGKLVNDDKDNNAPSAPKPKGLAELVAEKKQKDSQELANAKTAFQLMQEKIAKQAAEKKLAEVQAKKDKDEADKKAAEEKAKADALKAAQEKAAAELKAKQEKEAAEKKAQEEAEKAAAPVTVSLNGGAKNHDIPGNAKVWVLDSGKEKGLYNKIYVEEANGAIYSLGVNTGKQDMAPYVMKQIKEAAAAGIYAEFPAKDVPQHKAPEKDESKNSDKNTITVSVNGFDGEKIAFAPKGTKVYVNSIHADKEKAAVAWMKHPNGDWWKVGTSTGLKKITNPLTISNIEEDIKADLFSLWEKHHDKKFDPEVVTNKDFSVSIKGQHIAHVAADTKVYMADGGEVDTTPFKYVKHADGSWYDVTSSGSSKMSPKDASYMESHASNPDGLLVDITSQENKNLISESNLVEPQNMAEKQASDNESAPKVETSAGEVSSVKISGMDIKPGKYSIGKGFAKAFLLVHPDGTAEYQNKSGQKKKLTPAAFKKNWDAGMNKYAGPLDTPAGSPQAEPVKEAVVKPATGLTKGNYFFQSFGSVLDHNKEPGKVEILEDGSLIMKGVNNTEVTMTPKQAMDATATGFIVDEFGNSVFVPGSMNKPKEAHLFGSATAVSVYDLQDIRDEVAEMQTGAHNKIKEYTGDINLDLFESYMDKYFPNQVGAIKKSFVKAIDDILESLNTKTASDPTPGALPDPVKANFDVQGDGYVKFPEGASAQPIGLHWKTATELNQLIKQLATGFGDGTALKHVTPSKLSASGKAAWIQYFYDGEMNNLYSLEKNAGMKVTDAHPGAPANKDTHKVLWAPMVPGELPAGKMPEGSWTAEADDMTMQEIDNYLIKANMAYPEYLDMYYKKLWVSYHKNGHKGHTDSLSLKAKAAFDNNPNKKLSEAPVWTPDIKVAKSYQKYIDSSESAAYWPEAAKKEFVKDYPESIPEDKKSGDSYYWANELNAYVATLKAEEAAKKHAEYLESLKPKFEKADGQSVSGGHHEAMVLKDQFGKKWVYKPRDKNNIFLADVEQEAHTLAKAWGYKTSNSFITDFDNRSGHVQEMFDAERDLSGVSMSELNSNQVTDIAKEHLLDWALDNDDSWGANLLQLKNGSIVGIDKGRAFAAIGHWNGLSGDSSAHVHMPLVYTDLYKAIADKTISQEDAIAAYRAVIKQAKKMEKLSDSRMTESLERAFANRTNWAATGGPKNKEEAIKAALDRKNSLVSDMEKLWDNVFKKAGYDKPEPPSNVVENPDGQEVHLGVTPAALEQAKANGSYGASVFMSGPEVEDSHILLYHAKDKQGVDTLHGEMKIRHETSAYKDVEQWLSNNAVKVNNAYGYTPEKMKPTLPNEEDYYSKIIAGVKTISAHAMDGQYNASSLNGMSWVKNTLQNFVDSYESKMANDESQADLVKQYKDPVAFAEMAKKYLGFIAKAEEHKANGTKSAPGEFNRYEWTPPKKEEEAPPTDGIGVKVELVPAMSAKTNAMVPTFDSDDQLVHNAGFTPDGNPGSMYTVTLPTGEVIEFRGDTTGTPDTSKGLTRFRFPAGADEAASMERVRAQLGKMGLNVNDANEEDLELFYWRHLSRIMEDRVDSKSNAGFGSAPKYKKFQKEKPVETAKLSSAEELEAWKKAFANLTSREQIDEFVNSGGHLPKFGHYHLKDQSKYSGQPYWERFDVDDEVWKTKQLPSGAFYDDSHAEFVTMTGGMLSTEARLRTLGLWKGGMSSSADQTYGSAGFVFIRQNLEAKPDSSGYNLQHIYYSPKILKRTHNYSFSDDHYGNMKLKSEQSYFDFDKLTQHNGGSNEVMVKHAVSLLDDIEIVTFTDSALRDKVIKSLKDLGIDEIRGVPVEQRFVMRNKDDILAAQKAAKEAWKK